MKSKTFWIVIAILIILAIVFIAIPDGNDTEDEYITFGWITPLTGDGATIGQAMQVATQMSVDEINANGGINGKKVKVIYEDGKCNSKDAAAAANKLINIDKVKYIIGGACSSETMGAAPLAEASKVLLFSPCSTAPAITDAGDYTFRIIPSDVYQAQYAAEFAYNTLGKKKVAVIACLSDWCVGLKGKFTNAFKELGGEIVASEDYEQTAKDLKTQLSKVQGANPDLIYFVGYTEASVVGLKQAKELGINIQMLGADAWADPKIWEDVGNAGEGVLIVHPLTKNPEEFVAKMKAKGSSAELYTTQAYDVPKILAQQIAKVGEDPTTVKDSLYIMPIYPGVGGDVKFDKNGDVEGAAYKVDVVKGGKFVEY